MDERYGEWESFEAMVTDLRSELDTRLVRLKLAANDDLVQGYAREALRDDNFYYDGMQAMEAMSKYNLVVSDTEDAILTALYQGVANGVTAMKMESAYTDPELKRQVGWIAVHGNEDITTAKNLREDLKSYVRETYHLPKAICRMLVSRLEYEMREEVH